MIRISLPLRLGALAVVALMLTACAETRFVMATAKRLGDTPNKSQGSYKVGKPYQIQGVWYYPNEDWNYDETGIASWYGPQFHGKATANGEIFDQWTVSAAHKTLPLPSLVRVTNLENGRSLVIRINDRGPFKPGRIIDLSRRAAQLLGTEVKGTARVRVQILAAESQALAQRAKAGGTQLAKANSPIQSDGMALEPVVTETLSALPSSIPTPNPAPAPVQAAPSFQPTVVANAAARVPVIPTRLYIQAGAFSDLTNAERVKNRLGAVGNVSISTVSVNGQDLYRVRLGPVDSVTVADTMLSRVFDAGYHGARTVVETSTVD